MSGYLYRRMRRIGASPTVHSSHVLRATYPRAASSIGRDGVLMGYNLSTGDAFSYCPFVSYALEGPERLGNPNTVVAGGVGQGKSNWTLSYLARQRVFGRKARVFSPKPGEYDNLAALTGGEVISVKPGGSTIVNPLDAVYTADDDENAKIRPTRISALTALVETRTGREARADETSALALALDEVTRTSDHPTVPDVLGVLRDPTVAMLDALRLLGRWDTQLYDLTSALYDLCHGQYAGLVNGQTAKHLHLDADVVVYDLAPLLQAGRLALPLFMTVATAQLHNTLAHESRDNIIVVYEEGWRVLVDLGTVRHMQATWKLTRPYGLQNIIVYHRPSDSESGGAEGSLVRQLARGLLADTGTKIVFAPESQELDETCRLLALTDDEKSALRTLGVGECLIRLGDRYTTVHHERDPLEVELFSTDAGMMRRGTRAAAA